MPYRTCKTKSCAGDRTHATEYFYREKGYVANQDKTNKASKDYIRYINYLTINYPLDELDSKLLMVMKVRKDYPEYSLSQLLDIIHDEYDPYLTKSGLNHRLRRIKELALELQEKKKKENDDA